MNKNVPVISIVIPMYNVEKYIRDCLDSILAQTFTDYEVMAVDDCSTDKTCEIVESYKPKFGGKLRLIKSEKNSGGAGTPRNMGLRLASGEYIFLMDADDAIINTALEEFYGYAKASNADIVHCEKWYPTFDGTIHLNKNSLKPICVENITSKFRTGYLNNPAFISDNLAERVKLLCNGSFWWAPWSHFIKRSFLIENELKFSKLRIADDLLFSICLMISAKKILYIPSILYIWRILRDSNSRAILDAEKTINKRGGDIFKGIKILDKFTGNFKIFEKVPVLKYEIFDFFLSNQIEYTSLTYSQTPVFILDKFVRKELENVGTNSALTAYLFDRMNILQWLVIQQNEVIKQLNSHLTTKP